MADLCDTCGDGEFELLKKILGVERDSFDRLQQIIQTLTASSGGGPTANINVNTVGGTATSVGCGVSTAGTLRVAQATDCVVTTSNNNGAGAAAINIQDGGNSITVDGAITSLGTVTPGTAASSLGKAEDSVAASGDVGVFALGVANEAQTVLAADGDYIAHVTDTRGNHLVVGNLAHDAVDAGFPVKMGGQARTTNPAVVADGDRVNFIADRLGKQVVVGSIRMLKARQVTIITSSTAETTIVTADATNVRDLYGLLLTNTSATATEVTVRDATAGGTISSFMVPAGITVGFMLPESGAWPQATVNNNWTATCGTSVASLKVTALTVGNIA